MWWTARVTRCCSTSSAWGSAITLQLLLKHGARIDARDHAGKTPLYYAITGNQLHLAEILLAGGADGKATSRFQLPGCSTTMLELLKKYGAAIPKIRQVSEMLVTPEGTRLVVGLQESYLTNHSYVEGRQHLLLFDLANGRLEQRCQLEGYDLYSMTITGDSKALLLKSHVPHLGKVTRWELATGHITTLPENNTNISAHLNTDDTSEWIETYTGPATLSLSQVERATGKLMRRLPPIQGNSITFYDHERKGVTVAGTFEQVSRLFNNVVFRFYDLQTGTLLRSIQGGRSATMRHYVTPDGTRLLSINDLPLETKSLAHT